MIDVLVPLEQEGTEAVISTWLRAVGETVALNDPLVELETDKVSVEVPAPVSGIVTEILITAGERAHPGAVLARISPADVGQQSPEASKPPTNKTGVRGPWHSPAVRKALAESGLDPDGLTGTGRDGRLTLADVEGAIAKRSAAPKPEVTPAPQPARPSRAAPAQAQAAPALATSAQAIPSRSVPHDQMRLAIARNMLKSVTEAPQVTAVFEADFSAITAHRTRHRKAFEDQGVALSYTAYIVAAAAQAMRAVPQVNSRWHDDRLEIFDEVNIGIGTALGDAGLVVPVIRRVAQLSLLGIAAQLQDLTQRARDSRLGPEDMRGGTFTISNHGVSGSLLAAPIIINQPQSAILGIGKLEKRVIVREVDGVDTIQIRPMAYVSLTIDHRALDGHQTNGWLGAFVAAIEGWKD